MSFSLQRTVAAATLGALTLTASACTSDAAEGAADSELSVAVSALAASVDPVAELSASYLRAVGAAEGLTKIQPDGTVVPELATALTRDTQTEWTVTLDPERTFWSGEPVDAQAVADSLARSVELNELAAAQLLDVTWEVVDESTLRLTTQTPKPGLPYALGHYQLVIHNADAYGPEVGAATADDVDLTGPYQITGFNTERDMSLNAHDEWWGGEPGFESVTVTAVSDAQARAELALSGQADVVADYPVDRMGELEDSEAELISTSAANTVAVYLNPASQSAPALADVQVRQALAWGVDRAEMVDLNAGGLVAPTGTWLSSSPALAEATDDGYAFDADKAGSLLDAAGWELRDGVRTKDGENLTLRLLTFGIEKTAGEVLQAQWKKLGVVVEVRDVENTAVAEAIESGNWDMVTQAWTTLGDHAALIGGQIGPDGASNHAGLKVAAVPTLLARANRGATEETRTEALVELDRIITEEVPLVPLHPRVVASAISGVDGFVAHPLQYETLVTGALTPAG